MKIKKVQAIPLNVLRKRKYPQFVPLEIKDSVLNAIHTCFVNIETDTGLHGFGECTVREVPNAHAAIITDLFHPLLLGKDPANINYLWNIMFSTLRTRGHHTGIFMEALSGVDCALWDLFGKQENKSVHQLLGGAQEQKLKAYASSILFGEDAANLATKLVDQGYTQIKVKIGQGYDKDVKRIEEIRDRVGYDVEIMVDANSAYSTEEAIRLGKKLEKYEIRWFEEPTPPDNLNGYEKISRKLDIPIAAGESYFSKYTFADLIRKRVIDIIQPNVSRVGGITECKKILSIAESFEIRYAPHTGLSGIGCRAATLQIASTVASSIFVSYEHGIFSHPFADNLLKQPIDRFKQGYVEVPSGPGLGIEVDFEKVEAFRKSGIQWDDTVLDL